MGTENFYELLKEGKNYEKVIKDQFKKQFDIDLKEVADTKESQELYGDLMTEIDVGIEVKFDRRMKSTGNIYIELWENKKYEGFKRANIQLNNMVDIWIQGDERYFYYLRKSDIVDWIKANWEKLKDSKWFVKTATSKGVIIPEKVVKEELEGRRYDIV